MGFGSNMLDMVSGGVVGQAMGMVNDARQYNQAEKLQGLQIQGQKEMGEYNNRLALQMWKDTGYGAQKEQMKEAGLNPAMMYGKGGASAGSTNISAGQVSGGAGDAPKGGGEMQAAMGMEMNMRLMDAQAKQLESQARLNNVAADKAAGVDTDKGGAEIEGLKLDNQYKSSTMFDRVLTADALAQTAHTQMEQEMNNTQISNETKQDRINQIRANAIGAALENSLTIAKTAETKAAAKELAQRILLEQNTIDQKTRENNIRQMVADYQKDQGQQNIDQRKMEMWVKGITDVISDFTPRKIITGGGSRDTKHVTVEHVNEY